MENKLKGDLKLIALDRLELWTEGNVRKTNVLVGIDELSRNIRENGLLVPLVVRDAEPGKKYGVISGQRRLEACRRIGLSKVPCLVVHVSLDEARVYSLSENLYRVQMDPNDIADAVDYLYKKYGDAKKVGDRLGVSDQTVRKYLGYGKVTKEVKDLVGQKKITASQAIKIYTQFPDETKQVKVARELADIQDTAFKGKFYQAIKVATASDDVPKLRRRAEAFKEQKSFTITLPPDTSRALEIVALDKRMDVPGVIAQIIEQYVEERKSKRLPILD